MVDKCLESLLIYRFPFTLSLRWFFFFFFGHSLDFAGCIIVDVQYVPLVIGSRALIDSRSIFFAIIFHQELHI